MNKPLRYGDFHEYVRRAIRDPEDAAEYLSAAAEDGDNAVFLLALKDVLALHGSLSALSRKTGLSRANLHEMLRGKSSPRLDTLTKVLSTAGLGMRIVALRPKRAKRRPKARARATTLAPAAARPGRARTA